MKKIISIIILIINFVVSVSAQTITQETLYEGVGVVMMSTYKDGVLDNIGFCSSGVQMLFSKKNNIKKFYRELIDMKNQIENISSDVDSLVLNNSVRGLGKQNVYKENYWKIGTSKKYPKAVYYKDKNGYHITIYNFEYYKKESGHVIGGVNEFLHSSHPEDYDIIGGDIARRVTFNTRSYGMIKFDSADIDIVIEILEKYI